MDEKRTKELVSFVTECKKSGKDYRDSFKPTWDECEKQIRCVLPDSYNKKEDWQTKIFIPTQSKTSEIAQSYLNKMVFGKNKFAEISGNEVLDENDSQNLTELVFILFALGKFKNENNFVLQESVDLGTGFIKITMGANGFPKFTWRSVYNVLIDPQVGHDIDRARFIVDQFEKDISWVAQEYKRDGGMYDKEVLKKFLDDASEEAKVIRSNQTMNNSEIKESFMVVKGIDGTNDVEIPSKYKNVNLDECWCLYPNSKGEMEYRVISMLNDKYILRDDANVFGFIPYQWCRVKPRKYDCYGKGYIENTRGLQDLQNTLVNLAFDSQKISAMDIIIIDENKVKDPTTIKYKPLAVWKMTDVNGVKITRSQLSSMMDIMRGITLIDQIHQDATGATRQAQGAPSLSGSGTQSETLGEYQLKLQAIDQRFLDVGRFIESDYVVPLIKKIFLIIKNDKLFDQNKINRLIGMREEGRVEVNQTVDENGMPATETVENVIKVPKLDFKKISQIDEMEMDFRPVGVTQFTDKLEQIQKLREALQVALSNPTLTAITKIEELWKKIWQVSDIPDYDELLKSKEELAKEINSQPQIGANLQQMAMQGQGGQPADLNQLNAMMGQ